MTHDSMAGGDGEDRARAAPVTGMQGPAASDLAGSRSSHELPVVARLVVEIRSDGSATLARAGLSDELNNEKTVIEARGATPLALALDLARHLVTLSLQGSRAARALLGGAQRRPRVRSGAGPRGYPPDS